MKYGKGTITYAKDTIFRDNGQMDETGHPAMIPIASNEDTEEIYYLLITSNIGKALIYPDAYYDLSEFWEEVGLKKPSLINLQNIYVSNIDMQVKGGMRPALYKDVIKKFKAFQEQNPSKYYDEIKDNL